MPVGSVERAMTSFDFNGQLFKYDLQGTEVFTFPFHLK